MACAYARMKARRKMPAGQCDTSSRSSASRRATLIFVCSAIDVRVICCRSRCWRSRAPKLSGMRHTSQATKTRSQAQMTLGEEISRGSEPVRDGHRAASGEAAPSGKGSYTLRTESTNMCDAVQAGIMAERTPASSRPPRLRCIVSR